MTNAINDFHKDLSIEIQNSADSDGNFLEASFIEIYCNYLAEAGEFETCDIAQYKGRWGAKNIRVDGYSGDPSDNDGVLSLFISDFSTEDTISTITKKDLDAIFKRLENFYLRATDHQFIEDLEETSQGYGIAEMINHRDNSNSIRKVKLYILSNRVLSDLVQNIEEKNINGTPFVYNIWDLSRLERMVLSGKGKEDMDIDLYKQYQQTIPCLPAHLDNNKFETYLAVIPGALLSSIYDQWGVRLLEQNVRCFLQSRGNVNKGIRKTIIENPEMFLSYNNGITATAEGVEVVQEHGQQVITSIKNLQIVNGGQTTASIFSANKKDKANLDAVFVQMKLSIIPPEQTAEVVPKISEYANSQNKVNAADFFANHPYHVRIEEYSRRIWAPANESGFKESKWFYERARGQYLDEQAYKTNKQKDMFKREYPRTQLISKTDLAKYENVWEELPNIVSKGAQFNFSLFAKNIGSTWEKKQDDYNEGYFKHLIAKAIIFKKVEKLISNLDWYKADPGYRANIVAYSISWLAHYIKQKGMQLDFDKIWVKQDLSIGLNNIFSIISESIKNRLIDTPPGISNVTEWAKRPGCWEVMQRLEIQIPDTLNYDLITVTTMKDNKKDAKKVKKIDNDIEAQTKVFNLGGDYWKDIAIKAIKSDGITQKELGWLEIAVQIPLKSPNAFQAKGLLKVIEKVS
jgi:hypothetical protein